METGTWNMARFEGNRLPERINVTVCDNNEYRTILSSNDRSDAKNDNSYILDTLTSQYTHTDTHTHTNTHTHWARAGSLIPAKDCLELDFLPWLAGLCCEMYESRILQNWPEMKSRNA